MTNSYVIERDDHDEKIRRQLTDVEQAKRDNIPPHVLEPDPDIEGAVRLLAVGHPNKAAIEALLDKKRD